MQIYVNETTSMVDDQIRIIISELPPYSQLNIQLKTALPWCQSAEFMAVPQYPLYRSITISSLKN